MKDTSDFKVDLYIPYSSGWDTIKFPIYILADETYLCITYSIHYKVYGVKAYTKDELLAEGFYSDLSYQYLFKDISAKDLDL